MQITAVLVFGIICHNINLSVSGLGIPRLSPLASLATSCLYLVMLLEAAQLNQFWGKVVIVEVVKPKSVFLFSHSLVKPPVAT